VIEKAVEQVDDRPDDDGGTPLNALSLEGGFEIA